ncbi:M14 family metallopeptidase [Teichococcus oryzae]|uniref:Peptidase M14 n=1 Tax=Teichococcus oryzae TaxID=1608942 RepID=A0A5B2TK80_9PROT|nr:succinylglutamate desuccinylase/aspartoacylase family protein [Pseudoroseomonas oryzae]KAA2214554.1 peptidase M14 [Pseudoroseomonas oryzae]
MSFSGVLPRFPLELAPPDLRPWLGGNVLPGAWSFEAAAPGPHVALVSLVHGNEYAGAIVLARWLEAGLRPTRGRLTLVFANPAAFARFDPAEPTLSRFIDEDMNRVWSDRVLKGPRRGVELERARELLPLLESADLLLDLHSMLWPSDPLIITGRPRRAMRLAARLGMPPLVVADEGHGTGMRLIDRPAFSEPDGSRTAILVEGGQHWRHATLDTLQGCATALLRESGCFDDAPASPSPPPRLAEVTRTVVAGTHCFTFLHPFQGGEVIREAGTLLARDGESEIRTPHDDCLLVMPSPRTMRGHTAVRLARFLTPDEVAAG